MNYEVPLSLTHEEVNFLLNLLGQAPTASGAYPLFTKVRGMAQAALAEQMKPKTEEPKA
jgi:hypothetical protein